MMPNIHRLILGLVLLAALVHALPAQTLDIDEAQKRTRPSRWYGGGSLVLAQPLGEFDEYIDFGGGLAGHIMYQLSPGGAAAIRLDGGYIQYGSEKTRIRPFPRIEADVTTSNGIVFVGIGPQLMVPDGRVRPYIGGSVGLSYFVTESSISGRNAPDEDLFNTTNFDDFVFSWTGAGGIYIPLRKGLRPISLDIGARYHGNGRARYLREGSIQDNPDNSITITPIESETRLLTWHLGVSAGF